MKKIILGLIVSSFFIAGCSAPKAETKTSDSSSSSETIKSSERIRLAITQPEYSAEKGTFTIRGTAQPKAKISISAEGETEQTITVEEGQTFDFVGNLPDADKRYVFDDGFTDESVAIKSKATLEKDEADKKAQEEAAAAKKAEEDRIAKEKAEAEAAAKAQKEAEEAAKKEKEERIANAPREHQNALQKGYDYLDYTAFSKSGLYKQLVYEKFPEEAAQFAIDNIEADWNAQALAKAKDYLDYSSFSNQGLYDQLVYEGFTAEEAQYAIDNLPK